MHTQNNICIKGKQISVLLQHVAADGEGTRKGKLTVTYCFVYQNLHTVLYVNPLYSFSLYTLLITLEIIGCSAFFVSQGFGDSQHNMLYPTLDFFLSFFFNKLLKYDSHFFSLAAERGGQRPQLRTSGLWLTVTAVMSSVLKNAV